MRSTAACLVCTLALYVASAPLASLADVGDLIPVSYRPDSVVDGGALFDCPNERFAKPGPDSGTISADAVVATPGYRDLRFHVAIDSKDASSKGLDCVRFDFSGRGQFKDAPTIPLRALVNNPKPGSPDHYLHYAFDATEIKVVRNGKTIPALVRGEYTERGSVRWIGVKIGTGLQGTCQFGATARWLVILDGNGNLDCADPMNARLIDGKLVIRPEDEAGVLRVSNGTVTGDTILVDMAAPGAGRRRLVEQLYGQPMFVDGKWYQIKVSADRTKVSATQVDLPTGRVKTEHSSWSSRFIGESGTFVAIGIAQPEGPAIPAGKYAVMSFHEYVRGDGGSGSIICHNRDVTDGKPYIIEIKPGETTMVKVASPLTVQLEPKQEQRNVTLTLNVMDAAGGTVDLLQTGRADGFTGTPEVEIQDAAGKTLFTGPIKLTGHFSYSLVWPVPAGLTGPVTATVKNVTGPCPVTAKAVTFTVQ